MTDAGQKERAAAQKTLSSEQVEAFYHDEFVADQTADFMAIAASSSAPGRTVVDIGGGCGFFARRLNDMTGLPLRVIDMDPRSVEACRALGIPAEEGDALAPPQRGDEGPICFNLILHHLVGASEGETRRLQRDALRVWLPQDGDIFVNEYIYQSFVGTLSGRLIYEITKNKLLSRLGAALGRIIPSFKANTFGVGVRFRAHEEWISLFEEAGYRVEQTKIGAPEPISPPWRMLLIKTIRRDSFLLRPAR